MSDSENNQPLGNADAPYDSFEIISTDEGHKAVFYKAAIRAKTDREWPADTLERLEDRQQHFKSEGYETPLIDEAIVELRRVQDHHPSLE